jgi:hypothetical protein
MDGPDDDPWWIPLVTFAVHIFVGTGIFLLIGAAAVGLDLFMKWLEGLGVSPYIIVGLMIAKIALFSADVLLFLIYLANTSWEFVRGLHWRREVS